VELCFVAKHTRRSFFLCLEGKSAAFQLTINNEQLTTNNYLAPTSVIPLRGLHIAPKLLAPKANDGYGEHAERAGSMARDGT
jgi:hypothetical protein